MIGSYSCDKGLITRIYRELKKLHSQIINKLLKKWAHEFNREFLKEEVQIANKYMKKCSTSLAMKEIQIETTQRFHLTPVRMTIFKKKATVNAGEDVVKLKPYTL
jgi:hypothetical protein